MKVRRLKATVCALYSPHTLIIHSTRHIYFQQNINFCQTVETNQNVVITNNLRVIGVDAGGPTFGVDVCLSHSTRSLKLIMALAVIINHTNQLLHMPGNDNSSHYSSPLTHYPSVYSCKHKYRHININL